MRVVVCAVFLVGALMTMPASAQDAGAPPLGPETNVLYLHTEDGQDMWMNAQEVDGAAEAVCYKEPTPTELGDLCPNPGESFSYVFDLAPGLDRDLLLDPDGSIDIDIYWGGACCTWGVADYDLELASGDTVLGSGSGEHVMNAGDLAGTCVNSGCLYNLLSESFSAGVDRIAAADGLTLSVTGTGAWSHAAISTVAARGASTVTLPIIGTEGGPVEAPSAANVTYVDLDGPRIEAEYANATTQVVQYNWTAPANGTPALRIRGNVSEGSLMVDVVALADGNATLFDWNGTDAFDETVDIGSPCGENATCPLGLRFSMDGFVGDYSLAPVEEGGPAVTDGGPPGDDRGAGDGDAAGNETVDGADDGRESPGMPWLAAMVVVGSIAWARRRAG